MLWKVTVEWRQAGFGSFWGPGLALILNYLQSVTLRSIPPTVQVDTNWTSPVVSVGSFHLPACYQELNLLYRMLVIIIIHRNEFSWQLMLLILQCHGRAEALDYHVMMWRSNLKWWKGQEAVLLPALHKKLQVFRGVFLGSRGQACCPPQGASIRLSGGLCSRSEGQREFDCWIWQRSVLFFYFNTTGIMKTQLYFFL